MNSQEIISNIALIHNKLAEISVRGDDVLRMADALQTCRNLVAVLSQAEHDELASAVLITTSESLANEVQKEVEKQTAVLERKGIIEKSLDNYGAIILVKDFDEALPEKSMAQSTSASSIGTIACPNLFIPALSPNALEIHFPRTMPTSSTVW